MAERKVINKYFPPDYDPAKTIKTRHGSGHQRTVRLMAPYSMRCNTCGEFIYKGKKFNARKEIIWGEEYYGIKVFRFYIKCTRCSAEITFRTDPKNTDYAAEHGATRNFEPWRDFAPREHEIEISLLPTEEEEEEPDVDPMKALEQRTLESQREMEIMDALQDIRTRNARHERVDPDMVLQNVSLGKRREPEGPIPEETKPDEGNAEDEALVQKLFRRPAPPAEAEQEEEEIVGSAQDFVPDAASLLSTTSRAQLQSLAKPSTTKPPAKRRRGPNALGIVRK